MTDDGREAARPADAAALARELVSALEALATPPPGGFAPAAGPAPAGAPAVSLEWPRQLLENAARFVSPHLPADARMRSAKALVLRALRIVTRDQAVFNSAVSEALRTALVEIEGALARQGTLAADAAERTGALAARVEKEIPELRDLLERDARRADERLEALLRELREGAAAREAIGRELLEAEKRIDALERERQEHGAAGTQVAGLSEQVRLMRLEWSALRGSLAGRPGDAAPAAPRPAAASVPASPAASAGVYAQFEEAFRGDESVIRERQRKDVALFAGAPGPVADLGCGRGELLEVLAAAGVPAVGCDSNPVMVARAREKGLAVDEADLFSWLEARADGSLGGVTAYQVVEHLPAATLLPLVDLVSRKLAPGGRVLFETINPESVYAMRWFWMDLTHVRPVPAPSLVQLLSTVGFRDVTTLFRSPVPEADALPPGADPALEPVARLLFGPQDYAVTGVK